MGDRGCLATLAQPSSFGFLLLLVTLIGGGGIAGLYHP